MANKGSSLAARVDGQWVRPDWIEIYNGTAQTVNLQGWYLTDNENDPTKWRLPHIIIARDQYKVLFASEKDQKYHPGNYPYFDGTYYHTNFQLDRDGEYLALVKPDGVTIAHQYAPKYPCQRGLVSYGVCDADGSYGYFQNPTPRTRNDVTCISDVVGETKFSHDRGFYDAPFSVSIATETEGATIRYTTDGSAPSETRGDVYRDPVNISTTTTLRAMAFKPGQLPTDIDTQTYIFAGDVIRQTGEGFADTWGHKGADYEMDPLVVADYAGAIEDDLKSVPTVSLVTDADSWFSRSDGIYANPDWEDRYDEEAERAVSVEFFDAAGATGQFQIDAVVRIAGGSSTAGWKSDKLSMRLKFQEPQGPTKLSFSLFEEGAADRFDTLVLDARLNNAWNYGNNDTQRRKAQYTRDQFASDIQNALGGSGHHGQHVHLYLNGLYWGLYNLHERPDDSFAASYFGGNKKDYDSIKHNYNTVVSGSNADYRRMFDIAQAGLSSDARYQSIRQYLDVPDFIDYMITNFYYGNTDWSHQNWYASRNVFDPEGRWRYHSWDAEKGMQALNDNVTGKDDGYGSPAYLHQRLKSNPEYRMLFADHVHRHFFNDGLLTVDNAAALYRHRLDVVDRAVVGESARWGDNRIEQGGIRFTRDQHWVAQRDWLLNTYFPQRTNIVLNQLKAKDLYPDMQAPRFDPHGGWDSAGIVLRMTNLNGSGTIYYTTDGADPRLNMARNPAGPRYTGSVTLTASTHVKARVYSGGHWSAINDAIFAVGPVARDLRVTEIMYNPGNPGTEFIELKNVGAESLNLNLVRFVDAVDFTFPSMELAAGEYALVVAGTAAFVSHYGQGLRIAGEYFGSLDNAGERIELRDAAGQSILNFKYADGWYDVTDGMGFSLTIREPAGADPGQWDSKSGWRPSAAVGGSPGFNDASDIPMPGAIVINELLAHSHADAADWIELHNRTDVSIDIGGWFLSDSNSDFAKYEIAVGETIEPQGYAVFYEDLQFANPLDPGCHVPFALSENGETLYLHSGADGMLTGYNEQEEFGASETAVAFGRHRKIMGTYNFVPMSRNTPGADNAYPKVGPIVINEIMYNPASGNQDEEYIELLNIGDFGVTLAEFDNEQLVDVPWQLTDGGGISFDFPLAVTMAPGEYLVLAKSVNAFSNAYPAVGDDVQIFEWGPGKLDNSGEQVQLSKPGEKAEGVRYYISVDWVTYSDGSHPLGQDPWPARPDGYGKSLTRNVPSDYGNDPENWTAAAPSPGE